MPEDLPVSENAPSLTDCTIRTCITDGESTASYLPVEYSSRRMGRKDYVGLERSQLADPAEAEARGEHGAYPPTSLPGKSGALVLRRWLYLCVYHKRRSVNSYRKNARSLTFRQPDGLLLPACGRFSRLYALCAC